MVVVVPEAAALEVELVRLAALPAQALEVAQALVLASMAEASFRLALQRHCRDHSNRHSSVPQARALQAVDDCALT